MVSFPPCKINLGLHVVNKRPDGYHDLETCFYPVPWTDILEIIPSETLEFNSSGNSIPGNSSDNLCLKAYHLLKKDFDLPPVKIYLHKILPSGAGLGGGSSDAAHTLRSLNEIFTLNLSTVQLCQYASQLGSDCAFFIYDKPMMGVGRGEVLTPIALNLKRKFLVIVKPNLHISTADAFSGIKPRPPAMDLRTTLEQRSIREWNTLLVNDFEESVFLKHTDLLNIKNQLYKAGALYASLSGSGSAVVGIFENPVDVNSFVAPVSWTGLL
jgi:4-diphosphocytidyl-2-C-methyl-D-erythritol kinase